MRGPMYKNRIRGGRSRTSEPQFAKSKSVEAADVHPAVVRRRRLGLPRESCMVSLKKACRDAGTDEGGNLRDRRAAVSRRHSRQRERAGIIRAMRPGRQRRWKHC